MAAIDFDALRGALHHAENMTEYYGKAEQKSRQNAALVAAGLEPLHKDTMLKWDIEQGARFQKMADALRATLAHFGADQAEAA